MFFFNLLPILAFVPVTVIAQGVTCPFVYPPEINTTNSLKGLVFNVPSGFPTISLRPLQLRPNISEPGTFIAAIDNTSTVLVSNLIDGGFYSQSTVEFFGTGEVNLGPTGFLSVVNQVNGMTVPVKTTVWSLGFATRPTSSVDNNFILFFPGSEGTYTMSSKLGSGPGSSFGFIICEATEDVDNGAWYQIFYRSTMTTSGNIPSFPGCTFADLSVTIGPTIPGDGTCILGGFTAENISSD